ncbi:TPA: hypothetical protein DF272_00290 [Candidatus Falkowbacteria bacterium]|nr:hypothetical protein [Candidatus Falkowbacteria bacterium]
MFLSFVTIFHSAFLVFLVQPLIGKALLPWFGGSASVWVVSLVFFQVILFLGYLYTHVIVNKLNASAQKKLTILIIVVCVLTLPIIPTDYFSDFAATHPTSSLLTLLSLTIGLPFLLLASANPAIQSLFSRRFPDRPPYFLYAVSNAGSLLGLLIYPALFEVQLSAINQAKIWSGLFVVFSALFLFLIYSGNKKQPTAQEVTPIDRINWRLKAPWVIFPALTTLMLVAVSSHLSQNIAPVPLLWIVPLSIYLLSYILSFSRLQLYRRRPLFLILMFVSASMIISLVQPQVGLSFLWQVILMVLSFGFLCYIGHAEVYLSRPQPASLTTYYLYLSAGGALGGIVGSLLLPVLFPVYYELHLVIILFVLTTIAVYYFDRNFYFNRTKHNPIWLIFLIIPTIFIFYLIESVRYQIAGAEYLSRNFYGTIYVGDRHDKKSGLDYRVLINGPIVHGLEVLDSGVDFRQTTYYSKSSGVGLVLDNFSQASKRVGVIGLGTGSLVSYCRPGDYYRFYDINPDIMTVARTQFSYLDTAACEYDLVLGDGRVTLDREPNNNFDILIIDAFSSDAIPTHLLTAEAFDIYLRHLAPNGAVLFHLSNQYVDLRPVVSALAAHSGYHSALIETEADSSKLIYSSTWYLLSRNESLFSIPAISRAVTPVSAGNADKLWTDQSSNILSVIK